MAYTNGNFRRNKKDIIPFMNYLKKFQTQILYVIKKNEKENEKKIQQKIY